MTLLRRCIVFVFKAISELMKGCSILVMNRVAPPRRIQVYFPYPTPPVFHDGSGFSSLSPILNIMVSVIVYLAISSAKWTITGDLVHYRPSTILEGSPSRVVDGPQWTMDYPLLSIFFVWFILVRVGRKLRKTKPLFTPAITNFSSPVFFPW